ncbi:hypothetical protein [Rodentibacter pneumotropicus]|uniref:hypothetical protein n=1 Tax=Rodentibacter pneumotropicus TaxID=758 RepID=UPI00109D544B|nr:hypothetical protein [Rodentibacter pneumotropicus]
MGKIVSFFIRLIDNYKTREALKTKVGRHKYLLNENNDLVVFTFKKPLPLFFRLEGVGERKNYQLKKISVSIDGNNSAIATTEENIDVRFLFSEISSLIAYKGNKYNSLDDVLEKVLGKGRFSSIEKKRSSFLKDVRLNHK